MRSRRRRRPRRPAAADGGAAAQAQPGQPQQGESTYQQVVADEPVGRPPERDTRPPEIAPITEQPGVLTAQGKLVIEPGFQYGYSSNNRVALVAIRSSRPSSSA